MSNRTPKIIWLALICTALFVLGLTKLLLLRFEAGDVYPPYSSLRSDPLGTQILFESLNNVTPRAAARNFRPLDKISLTPRTTLLFCGLPANTGQLNAAVWKKLMDHLADDGGQLVVSFAAAAPRADQQEEEASQEERQPKDANATSGDDEDLDKADRWHGLEDLGLGLERAGQEHHQTRAMRAMSDLPFLPPASIPWHGALYFDLQDPAWLTVYAWQQRPVVVQRSWGKGVLIMATDSYLLSNEALRKDRRPRLLAWLLVPEQRVIFDESHNGLHKQPGIASLARKYRLHGVVGVLLLLTALFIWQQTSVFVPQPAPGQTAQDLQPAMGRDTSEGLANLMRTHIRSAELLKVCYESWHTSAAVHNLPEGRVAAVEALVKQAAADPRSQKPIDTYIQICDLLEQGRHK